MDNATILPALVALPLIAAVLPPVFKARTRLDPSLIAGAVAVLAVLAVASQRAAMFAGEMLLADWAWMPGLGLHLSFRMDGLGFMFALLITLIGLLVVVYARYYLTPEDATGRFYSFLLLFMGAMLGIALSENLLQLLVFWELTSLTSFLLIGYWRHESEARQGARLALLVTGAGGMALLGAVLLIGHIVGSYQLSEVLESGDAIRAHPLYEPALALFLLGVFTKSAQFPFHFWLPHAMAAPTPVSAYLHSATMVKAGVFLLARLFPALAGTESWFFLVGGIGLVTLLAGAYHALFQHDLKGLLAYSTVSHLGLITLLFGLGTSLGAIAAVFHIMNHATFKASLFMATGIIDHECGSRDMRRLNGLMRYMPFTAVLAITAAGAMAGVPLLNGFLSKEMFFAEAVHQAWLGAVSWGLPAAALLAGIGSVAYSARFVHDVFFNGEPVDLPRDPHEAPLAMRLPVAALVVTCILVGIFPEQIGGPLLRVASASVTQRELPEFSLSPWHGFNLPLLMSVLALGGGVVVYTWRERIFAIHDRIFPPLSGRRAAELMVERAYRFADLVYGYLDARSLQRYVALLLTATAVAGLWAYRGQSLSGAAAVTAPDAVTIVGALIMLTGIAATVVLHRQRLLAVIAIGVVGLMVALTLARFSGPDLAMTQLLVEIVTVVLMLLALHLLPSATPPELDRSRRSRDITLALLLGTGAGALTWATLTSGESAIAEFFLAESVPGGGGHNVVNVILVDFRGFDTFGEIVVMGIAAIGFLAVGHEMRIETPATDGEVQALAASGRSLVLEVIARLVLPVSMLVSVYLLLRGHNAPGGGFIAGLVASGALVLQYLARGTVWVEERLKASYPRILAIGVLVAGGTGVGSWLVGHPFLTSAYWHVHLPLLGEFELATAMLFDIGVYLTVIGAVMTMLSSLARLGVARAESTA